MRRERLKDLIREPRISLFDTLVKAVLALVVVLAACYAVAELTRPPRRTVAGLCQCGLPFPTGTQVTLTATKNRCFYTDQHGPILLDHFDQHLSSWLKQKPTPRVVVTADNSALFSDAMELLDLARRHVAAEAKIIGRP